MPTFQTLEGLTVAISISDRPYFPKESGGSILLHDMMVTLSESLLSKGAALAYGGVPPDYHKIHEDKPEFLLNFTELLSELVRKHLPPNGQTKEKVKNYIAWPIHLRLKERTELNQIAEFDFLKEPLPNDVKIWLQGKNIDTANFLTPNTSEALFAWSRCLTIMRQKMVSETDARIVMGGRLLGYKGRYPGLFEEAYLSLSAKQPLYLLGGFGGCGRVLSQAARGMKVEEITESYQVDNHPGYKDLLQLYNEEAANSSVFEPINYENLYDSFASTRISGLHNGLNEADNQCLFETILIDEAVYLINKGLKCVMSLTEA